MCKICKQMVEEGRLECKNLEEALQLCRNHNYLVLEIKRDEIIILDRSMNKGVILIDERI